MFPVSPALQADSLPAEPSAKNFNLRCFQRLEKEEIHSSSVLKSYVTLIGNADKDSPKKGRKYGPIFLLKADVKVTNKILPNWINYPIWTINCYINKPPQNLVTWNNCLPLFGHKFAMWAVHDVHNLPPAPCHTGWMAWLGLVDLLSRWPTPIAIMLIMDVSWEPS